MTATKFIRSLLHSISYNLYIKRKLQQIDQISLFGLSVQVSPTVFHPQLYRSSKIFASFLLSQELTGKKILDIGCGSGILSLIAASKGANVLALDLNPAAVQNTQENACRNNLQNRIEAIESDLFTRIPSKAKFDLILSNPPYYTGIPKDVADHAWKGGEDHDFFLLFARNVGNFLNTNGKIYLILSSDSDMERIQTIFKENDYILNLVLFKYRLFEKLMVFSLERKI